MPISRQHQTEIANSVAAFSSGGEKLFHLIIGEKVFAFWSIVSLDLVGIVITLYIMRIGAAFLKSFLFRFSLYCGSDFLDKIVSF